MKKLPDGSAVSRRGRFFTPVVIGGVEETLVMFSSRETLFLDKFLSTMNLQAACDEIGVDMATGRRMLRRGKFKTYLDQKFREAALAAGISVQNHLAWLRQVRDGTKEVSENQLEAAKMIGRHLHPAGGGTVVNIQNNVVGSVGPSPYSDYTAEQLQKAMRDRVDSGAFQERPSGAA